jgi:hypothetical protein
LVMKIYLFYPDIIRCSSSIGNKPLIIKITGTKETPQRHVRVERPC